MNECKICISRIKKTSTQKWHVDSARCTKCIPKKNGPHTHRLHAPPFLPPTTPKQANTTPYAHTHVHVKNPRLTYEPNDELSHEVLGYYYVTYSAV